MASALLSRTLTGLRSARSSLSFSHFSSISTSLLKEKPFYTRANFVSLATPTSHLIRCGLTPSSGTRTFTTQSMTSTEPVISVDWLHSNLQDPNVKVLDASWYMPDEQRNPLQEYQVAHIPGALFFDVDGISDRSSNLPHMLPSEEGFAAAVSALGIQN